MLFLSELVMVFRPFLLKAHQNFPHCTIMAISHPIDEFTNLVFLIIAGVLHPGFERCFDLGPFALNNTVKNRVAVGAIWHDHVITQHALFHRSQAFDSPLRFDVEQSSTFLLHSRNKLVRVFSRGEPVRHMYPILLTGPREPRIKTRKLYVYLFRITI